MGPTTVSITTLHGSLKESDLSWPHYFAHWLQWTWWLVPCLMYSHRMSQAVDTDSCTFISLSLTICLITVSLFACCIKSH